MNILSLTTAPYAGLPYNLCYGINKYTEHKAHQLTWRYRDKFGFPTMGIKWTQKTFDRLIEKADVVHINENMFLQRVTGKNMEKPIVYHAHGSKFRARSKTIIPQLKENYPNLTMISSTLDLEAREPEAKWFPSPVPISEYRELYKTCKSDPPRMYYSPSKFRYGKKYIIAINNILPNLEVNVTKDVQHPQNLEMKSKYDIYFDELQNFYGVNAIEAAGFGMNVIYGMDRPVIAWVNNNDFECPFILCTKHNLLTRLEELLNDKAYREQNQKESLEYALRVHDLKPAAERFINIVNKELGVKS